MRFLILGCLHGQMPKLKYKRFDAVICTGDFCSDAHRPAMFAAIKEELAHPGKKVNWYDLVGKAEAKRLIDQSVRDGRRLLEHLDSLGVPVYVVPGNNDWTGGDSQWAYERKDHYKMMRKGLENIIDLNGRSLDIGEFTIIGYGNSSGPEVPQYLQDVKRLGKEKVALKRKEYARLRKEYDKLFKAAENPVILLSHNVPYNTKIDKIDNPASPRNGQHFGSLLVRDLVERHAPVVCLGAHMHEHFGAIKIGKTPCVNAGYGARCNVLMELRDDEGLLKFSGKAQKY